MQSIVVEVTGLKKDERQNYSKPGETIVNYEAEFRAAPRFEGFPVVGGFYASMRFAAPADAPRIGDRFLLTLTPVVDIPEVEQRVDQAVPSALGV